MSRGAAAPEDEAALAARARGGDVAAFEALYHRSGGRIFALCLRMCGDRAQATELTHDAFVRAWERISQYRGDSAFGTWMHRLAVNLVLERLRGDRRREARVTLAHTEDTSHRMQNAADPATSDILDRVDLERAIAALPPNARLVFVMHDVEGFRHEEIAQHMHLAQGTVRAHLHRARQLLMRMLQR